MIPLAVIAICGLCLWRIARVIAEDTIAEPLRVRLYRWAWRDTERIREHDDDTGADRLVESALERPEPRGVARAYCNALLTCPHCLGVWLAPVVYAAARWGGHVPARDGVFGALVAIGAIMGFQSALELAVGPRAPGGDAGDGVGA